jgi:hypothetical protein
VLLDLERWRFGGLLARRAGWELADPGRIDALVQAYRRRILAASLRCAGHAVPDDAGLPGDDPAAWEAPLVADFLGKLQGLAPLGEAELKLARFAHGQYYKYSRRVAWLMGLERVLPCAYAAPAGGEAAGPA